MGIRKLLCKIFLKACEILLRALTWLRKPQRMRADPSEILLQCRTEAQFAADKDVKSYSAHSLSGRSGLIVIPFRDNWTVTKRCLDSILAQELCGLEMKVVLVDNNSTESSTLRGLDEVTVRHPSVSVLRCPVAFNFSYLNNAALKAFAGVGSDARDWVIFCNNDIELRDPLTIFQMVAFAAANPHCGAVGCLLEYPDGTWQHLFAAPGVKIVAAHPLRRSRVASTSEWFSQPRSVGAVTGALMLVRFEALAQVGGWDERLPTLGQDIDLCLSLQKLGLVNWTLPHVVAVHHEGLTRGEDLDRLQVGYMYRKWGRVLTDNPFYSRKLSRWSEWPVYTAGEGDYPWEYVL